MIHAETLCTNPLTGRRAWLLRHIPAGDYGQPWDACIVISRRHWWDRTALLQGAEHIDSVTIGRELRGCIAQLGFADARAVRHGRVKTYRVKTRGFTQ